eukprot:m.317494 g.317494  ORF g.317494 m.317494 type:complete len:105 (-) comp16434_c0_seq25:1188-1502(-)
MPRGTQRRRVELIMRTSPGNWHVESLIKVVMKPRTVQGSAAHPCLQLKCACTSHPRCLPSMMSKVDLDLTWPRRTLQFSGILRESTSLALNFGRPSTIHVKKRK